MLDEYKKNHGAWRDYQAKFLGLMAERKVEDTLAREVMDGGCLLCSEPTPENCHRRLVAEYLRASGAMSRSSTFCRFLAPVVRIGNSFLNRDCSECTMPLASRVGFGRRERTVWKSNMH